MAATPTATGRGGRGLLLVWLVGAAVAACLGLVAALIRPEQFWLVFGVFAACTLSPCVALSWLLLGAGRLVEPDPRLAENVESRWLEKAGSAALLDVIPAAGITAGAVALLGLDVPADLALVGVMAFALVDGGLRYLLLSRRES